MFKKLCESKKIIENIYCIKSGIANMYLYKYDKKYIAIDCGAKKEIVAEELEKLNINAKDITHVFLTHSDYDHVAALSLFTKAIVYMGHEEEQMINKTTPRFLNFRFNKKLECEKYNLLLDQEEITIGNVIIKAIATPGHTPGSMSYLFNNLYLFVGDALAIKKDKITPFTKLFVMDMETHINSIKKINNIRRAKGIFTAHYGYLIK